MVCDDLVDLIGHKGRSLQVGKVSIRESSLVGLAEEFESLSVADEQRHILESLLRVLWHGVIGAKGWSEIITLLVEQMNLVAETPGGTGHVTFVVVTFECLAEELGTARSRHDAVALFDGGLVSIAICAIASTEVEPIINIYIYIRRIRPR